MLRFLNRSMYFKERIHGDYCPVLDLSALSPYFIGSKINILLAFLLYVTSVVWKFWVKDMGHLRDTIFLVLKFVLMFLSSE